MGKDKIIKSGYIICGRIKSREYQWQGGIKVYKDCDATKYKLRPWMEQIEGPVLYWFNNSKSIPGEPQYLIDIMPPPFLRIKEYGKYK